LQAAGRRQTDGARRRWAVGGVGLAGGEPNSASRPPNSTGRTPGGRGEDGEAHQGLGGEGRAPGEEIDAGRRSSGDLHGGGGAARRGKGGGVVREV
jgi:hypothetical protein